MRIRKANKNDFNEIWPFFQEIVNAGETYAIDRNISKEDAYDLIFLESKKVYVIEDEKQILGTYYIKKNQEGPGSHICNCGYMVSKEARGLGLATKMCLHSQEIAKGLGFKGMQFNSVVSTNLVAVKLWKKLDFKIVGTIPNAFLHAKLSYVDSYIMFKNLV